MSISWHVATQTSVCSRKPACRPRWLRSSPISPPADKAARRLITILTYAISISRPRHCCVVAARAYVFSAVWQRLQRLRNRVPVFPTADFRCGLEHSVTEFSRHSPIGSPLVRFPGRIALPYYPLRFQKGREPMDRELPV